MDIWDFILWALSSNDPEAFALQMAYIFIIAWGGLPLGLLRLTQD